MTVELPVDERADAWWLEERWRPAESGRLNAFYGVKPLIPRVAQLALRRGMARRQRRRSFPSWPYEDVLLRRRCETLRAELRSTSAERLALVGLWPEGRRFAYVLTHDVEGIEGIRRIPRLLELEQRHGIVSTFNFCGAWYPVAEDDLEAVRGAGCEVGLHGMEHDNRLFASRASFEANLPRVAERMREWGAVGFRSPAVHRWAPWMQELPARYDSSFPHSDPFQAQPGGCCSVHPFFFGDVVELPITLDQDFTLFDLLRERTSRLWIDKSRWIIGHCGLVNVIVHPDYLTPERMARYEELLIFLRSQEGGWHALSRDVADWWRARAGLTVLDGDRVAGPGAESAAVWWARPVVDRITYEL